MHTYKYIDMVPGLPPRKFTSATAVYPLPVPVWGLRLSTQGLGLTPRGLESPSGFRRLHRNPQLLSSGGVTT